MFASPQPNLYLTQHLPSLQDSPVDTDYLQTTIITLTTSMESLAPAMKGLSLTAAHGKSSVAERRMFTGASHTDRDDFKTSKHKLDYTKCTKKELKSFLKNRGIAYHEDAPTPRSTLTRALRRADAARTFRFNDLAPELRNHIYDELLIVEDGSQHCFPQILATCSGIYKEAAAVLNEENRVTIDPFAGANVMFAATESSGGGFSNDLSVATLTQRTIGPANWPSLLLRLPQLRISIELSVAEEAVEMIREMLTSLLPFLQMSGALQTLTVVGDIPSDASIAELATIGDLLRPFSRLITTVNCDFEGFERVVGLRRRLRRLATANKDLYALNLEYRAALLQEELNAYIATGRVPTDAELAYVHQQIIALSPTAFRFQPRDPDYEENMRYNLEVVTGALDHIWACMPFVAPWEGSALDQAYEGARRRRIVAFSGWKLC